MKNIFYELLGLLGVVFILSSCVSVKEFQKSRINDSDMILSNRLVEKEELNMLVIKEGAAGANSGKSGGGCGCN